MKGLKNQDITVRELRSEVEELRKMYGEPVFLL